MKKFATKFIVNCILAAGAATPQFAQAIVAEDYDLNQQAALTSMVVNEAARFVCYSTSADTKHTIVRWSQDPAQPARVFNLEEMTGLGKDRFRYPMNCQFAGNFLVGASRYTGTPICLSAPAFRNQVIPNEVRFELARIQDLHFGSEAADPACN
jgi:hypothetical protein